MEKGRILNPTEPEIKNRFLDYSICCKSWEGCCRRPVSVHSYVVTRVARSVIGVVLLQRVCECVCVSAGWV